jgi:Protein of unknown function (DUF3365)
MATWSAKARMISVAAAILSALPIAIAADETASRAALLQQARNLVSVFSEKPKNQLVEAMKAGGPVTAIEVCKVAAPVIAHEVSTEGWSVGRTALKLRNPHNKPDEWERQTLELFVAERARGADAATLERTDLVEVNGVRTFRFMKAIPTGELCLSCHGSELKDPVRTKITHLYPADQAAGFKLGDIRGAFTLSKPLQ